MRLLDHNDTPLVTGLIVASIVIFHQPLRSVLDFTHEIESYYHLDLVPALVVLCFAVALHQSRRRHLASQEALAAAEAARHHAERAQDLELLVSFGRAVAKAQDFAALERVIWRDLPTLAGERAHWVAIGSRTARRVLARSESVPESAEATIDAAAERVAASTDGRVDTQGVTVDGFVCFPLVAGDEAVGSLGVEDRDLDDRTRRSLVAGAAVLAIAVRNVAMMHETMQKSFRDSLTGCYNRAYARESLERELLRAKRHGRPPAVLMLDVDGFKAINDRHGHLSGDRVLRAIADTLRELFRSSDPTCRYAGDEFLVILPETPLGTAEQLAEQLREQIALIQIPHQDQLVRPTVSVGVTAALQGELDVEAVVERADRAMYHAKQAGRNECSTLAPTPSTTLVHRFLDTFPPCETGSAGDRPDEPENGASDGGEAPERVAAPGA